MHSQRQRFYQVENFYQITSKYYSLLITHATLSVFEVGGIAGGGGGGGEKLSEPENQKL